jgi:hypothetical protein
MLRPEAHYSMQASFLCYTMLDSYFGTCSTTVYVESVFASVDSGAIDRVVA